MCDAETLLPVCQEHPPSKDSELHFTPCDVFLQVKKKTGAENKGFPVLGRIFRGFYVTCTTVVNLAGQINTWV